VLLRRSIMRWQAMMLRPFGRGVAFGEISNIEG
jgi:hypothetical protein